jgi:butyrate kinase
MKHKVFVINLGSSSTKVACFEDKDALFTATVRHPAGELKEFRRAVDQSDYRLQAVLQMAEEHHCDLAKIDLFMSRGGLLRPAPGGIYAVNQQMLNDLMNCRYGEHACNAGPVIAYKLARKYDKPAFIKDPPTVDEFDDLARVTGLPSMKRVSRFHALNQKEAARRGAAQLRKRYEDARLIVAHLGGGITVGVHENGRVVDATNPNDEGPLSTDRTGCLPNTQLVKFCFSENRTLEDVFRVLFGQGGLVSYTDSTDLKEIMQRRKSDSEIQLLIDTMLYRIAFWICGFAARLKGKVDGIILTGGMVHDSYVVDTIRERVGFLAPFLVFPGEFEMEALAAGGMEVLEGKAIVKVY